MIKLDGIFNGFVRSLSMIMAVVVVCGATGAYADTNCDDPEKYPYINPALALCTTHAYNIGYVQNPDTANSKQMMRDVVALKTTVMTQQMKKQYDYLESTLRRIRAQLEKAVLTTQLQAAGAADEDAQSRAAATSTERNISISGAKNCMLESGTLAGLQCIQNNIRMTINAVNAGNYAEAKNQLDKDLGFAASYGAICGKKSAYYKPDNNGVCQSAANADTNVTGCNNLAINRDKIYDCAEMLNVLIGRRIEQVSRQDKMATGGSNR